MLSPPHLRNELATFGRPHRMRNLQAMTVQKGVRLHSLDLLRGICAVGVAAYHFSLWSEIPLASQLRGVLGMFGTYGVSVFFVLSGYSLAYGYAEKFSENIHAENLLDYFKRRFARLAPLFATVVLLSIVGKLFLTGKSIDPFAAIGSLLLLFGVVNPAATPVIGGWSIGIEVVFYLMFPLLVLIKGSARLVVPTAILISAWLSRDLQAYASLEQGWNLYVQPANHWIFFSVGVYIHLLDTGIRRIPTWALAGLVAVVVVVMAITAIGASELELVTGWRRLVLVFAALALVAVLAAWQFEWEAMKRISHVFGGLSYPLYLLHPLVFFAARNRVNTSAPLWCGLLLASTFAMAIAVDRWIDTPIQRKLKKGGW